MNRYRLKSDPEQANVKRLNISLNTTRRQKDGKKRNSSCALHILRQILISIVIQLFAEHFL